LNGDESKLDLLLELDEDRHVLQCSLCITRRLFRSPPGQSRAALRPMSWACREVCTSRYQMGEQLIAPQFTLQYKSWISPSKDTDVNARELEAEMIAVLDRQASLPTRNRRVGNYTTLMFDGATAAGRG
jgi:hypothetical protein